MHKHVANKIGIVVYAILIMSLVKPAVAETIDNLDCKNAMTTLDMNYCAARERDAAYKKMRRYLIASYSQYDDNPEIVESIKASQQAWDKYADSNCKAVYTQWQTGSIRNIMAIDCRIRLSKQRTHELWLNYLTFMDSTPPVLPEPSLD